MDSGLRRNDTALFFSKALDVHTPLIGGRQLWMWGGYQPERRLTRLPAGKATKA